MSVVGKALDLPLLNRIIGYVKPYRRKFIFVGSLTLAIAFLSPVRPWLIQYALDVYVQNGDLQGLLSITILMISLLLVESLIQFYQTYAANWVGQSVIKDLRVKVFDFIVKQRLKFFDRSAIGTLVTRSVSDIETIADIFSQGILIIIGDLLKLLVVIAVMFTIDWRLALISLSTIPILIIATYIFKNAIKKSFQNVRTEVTRLNAFVQEHIIGMLVIQVFNRENAEMKAFKKINRRHRDAHIASVWAYSIFFPIVEILSALSIALMVWFGAKEIIMDTVTIGNLVAFILYINMLFRPIRQLADRFNTLQMGMVASERVFKLIDNEQIVTDGEKEISRIANQVKFDDLWFAYTEEQWVLRNVSFKVKVGQTLAIVGATGAGKSSIINLISRFYEFQKGSILIDDCDIRDISIESLRSKIGVVLQDVFLFSDTIHNNITLNNPAISREQIIAAAKEVGAHDFIMQLTENYDYNVHERGAMLSVGQRQLISFIRAYVYNPSLLVLDEATSSIDTETEEVIQKAIAKLTHNRTSIIIAHRLSTIQRADQILLLDNGEVKELGTHNDLLKQKGLYFNLFEKQYESEQNA